MSSLTFAFAYLVRLEVWGLAVALFQGGLVVLSWFAWERAMARATAAARHRLACIHFAALAVLPALTMVILHWTIAGMGVPASHGSPVAELPALVAGYRGAFWLSLPLAALWFAGASVMALRLVLEARRMGRLDRGPAPAALVEAVHRLARDRIGAPVPNVRVADIVAPQIIGLRRPVLLAPRDLAMPLPTAEWEAVLLHELAHVRRGDFGWNLLQRIELVLLWFHPAAWALYGHLSREREACCDALAVRHGASPTGLARALVRLAENHARPRLGMAISSQGELTTRVHRLLGLSHPSAPSAGLRMAALTVSALCLMALWAGRLGLADPSLADIYNASALGPTVSVDAYDAAGSFVLQIKHGRVVAASVGKQRLPPDRILQQDDRVTLLGALQKPIVAFTVTPQDRIEWKARR